MPYIVQRGAEAVFTDEGMKEIQANLDYYRKNAAVIAAALDEAGGLVLRRQKQPLRLAALPRRHEELGFL